jgi:hypothetical protein
MGEVPQREQQKHQRPIRRNHDGAGFAGADTTRLRRDTTHCEHMIVSRPPGRVVSAAQRPSWFSCT